MDKKHCISHAPEWDNETRAMLAITLDKPAPLDDDKLVTTKKNTKSKKTANYSYQYTDSQSQGFYFQSQSSPSSSNSTKNRGDISSLGGFVSASSIHDPRPSKRVKTKVSRGPVPKKPAQEVKMKPEPYKHVKKESNI
jgi:hypothetical protein